MKPVLSAWTRKVTVDNYQPNLAAQVYGFRVAPLIDLLQELELPGNGDSNGQIVLDHCGATAGSSRYSTIPV